LCDHVNDRLGSGLERSNLFITGSPPHPHSACPETGDGIAAALTGHWRPYGVMLGQMLIMEGYPLA